MTKHIAIYTDAGAGANSVQQWIYHFDRLCLPYRKICATDVLNGELSACDICILPGGADIPYCQKLHGQGVQYIRHFVQQGGHFVGSCAGAYFAHSHITWHNGGETIVGKRQLALFNGTATGPLHAPYVVASEQGAVVVPMTLTDDVKNIGTALTYANGAPKMAVDADTLVLAVFGFNNTTYPAIIQKPIGNGTATALSPHIEYSESFLKNKIPPCPNRPRMCDYVLKHIVLK